MEHIRHDTFTDVVAGPIAFIQAVCDLSPAIHIETMQQGALRPCHVQPPIVAARRWVRVRYPGAQLVLARAEGLLGSHG